MPHRKKLLGPTVVIVYKINETTSCGRYSGLAEMQSCVKTLLQQAKLADSWVDYRTNVDEVEKCSGETSQLQKQVRLRGSIVAGAITAELRSSMLNPLKLF